MNTLARRLISAPRIMGRAGPKGPNTGPMYKGAAEVFGAKHEQSRYMPLPSEKPGEHHEHVAEFLRSPSRSVLMGGDGVFNTETRIYDPYPTPEKYAEYTQIPNPPRDLTTERWCRHRKLVTVGHDVPLAPEASYIAENASISADVLIGENVSIHHGCVIRGDENHIEIGAYSTVEENTVIHAAERLQSGLSAETFIGHHSHIGANCVLRSCSIMAFASIGANSVICEGAIVETNARVLPNSVVPPGRIVPEGQVWGGNPVTYVRKMDKNEIMALRILAEDRWLQVGQKMSDLYLPVGTQWWQKEIVNEIEENQAHEYRKAFVERIKAENQDRAAKIAAARTKSSA